MIQDLRQGRGLRLRIRPALLALLAALVVVSMARAQPTATPQDTPAAEASPSPEAAATPPPMQAEPTPAPTPELPPLDLVEPFDAAVVGEEIQALRERLVVDEQRLAAEAIDEIAISDLPLIRQRAERVRGDALAAANALNPALREVEQRLTDLGPPPIEGMPAEPQAIAARRQQLQALSDEITAAQTSLSAVVSRAERLTDAAVARRRDFYVASLLTPGPSPLDATTWREAQVEGERLQSRLQQSMRTWRVRTEARGEYTRNLVLLVLGGVVALVLLWPVSFILRRRLLRFAENRTPTVMGRLALAAYRVIMVVGLGALAVAALYIALRLTGLWTVSMEPVWLAVGTAIVLRRVTVSTVRALATPRHPNWRLLPVDNAGARWLVLLSSLLTLALAIDHGLQALLTTYGVGLELKVVIQAIFQAIGSIVLLAMTLVAGRRIRLSGDTNGEPKQGAQAAAAPLSPARALGMGLMRWGRWLLLWVLRLVPLVLLVLGALGYLALSEEITRMVLGTGVLIAGYLLMRGLLHASLSWLAQLAASSTGAAASWSDDDTRQGGTGMTWFWVGVCLDLALLTGFIPLAMLLVGMEWSEILTWLERALTGFRLGSVTISIADILVAVLLLSLLLAFTRLLQRLLVSRVFPRTTFDVGIRDSFTTIVGYIGLAIAVSVAVSYVGVDLSNLAIIAGALSVGIGFGLQSIVNNFVSGLILLFERPIKVGDWVVSGGYEGTVRKISVRSTEIETFEKATIIMPNSELISAAVQNWTHRNKVARMTIAVGVSYSTDPDLVRRTLLEIAQENRDILRYPAPYVFFADFGESSLDFQLRCFLRDVDTILDTASEIRYAIVRKFRHLEIEIPFPQRVVTVTHELAEVPPQGAAQAGSWSPRGRAPPGEIDTD